MNERTCLYVEIILSFVSILENSRIQKIRSASHRKSRKYNIFSGISLKYGRKMPTS